MSTTDTTDDERDRFDADIYNLDIARDDWDNFDETPCEIDAHEGRKAFVFAIGPNGQDVRQATVCTACGFALEEVAFPDATGLVVEARGRTASRVHNETLEQETISVPIDYDAMDAEDPVVVSLQLDPSEPERAIVGYVDVAGESEDDE